MTTTPNPIPIPRDLKPGDILITRGGDRREFVRYDNSGHPQEIESDMSGPPPRAWRRDGTTSNDPDWDIIRIERIASKARKAKVDIGSGAECIKLIKRIARECAHRKAHEARKLPNHLWLEIRAIARRLNGGGK